MIALISINVHRTSRNEHRPQRCKILINFLSQVFLDHELTKTFTKFFHRYKDLVRTLGCTQRRI